MFAPQTERSNFNLGGNKIQMIIKHTEMLPDVIDQTVRALEAIKGNPPFLSHLTTAEQVKIAEVSCKVMDFIKAAAQRQAKNHAQYFPLDIPFEKNEKE
jgi:hypothetical protein